MITISAERLSAHRGQDGGFAQPFRCQDDGDAFSAINAENASGTVMGYVHLTANPKRVDVRKIGNPDDTVRVIARKCCPAKLPDMEKESGASDRLAEGYVRRNGQWEHAPVMIVPVRKELFSRTRGLLETGVLADKCVFTAGVGSGASPVVLELAKVGVMHQILMDYQRLEVANVVRHVAGVSDVGRYKTKVVAGMLREKNPYSHIETWEAKVDWDTQDLLREIVRRSHLVLSGVDDHDARVILNRVCVEENKPLILAGCFRRAYGGQILVVKPGETPCYQCFLRALPETVRDQEISSPEAAARIAYSDRPVEIEPGLATDIAPISLMVAKLAIQILMAGRPTTLRSLDDDLAAPWYIWLNRREPGTDYEHLKPLAFNVNGMHVLRWYGVQLDRDPDCPCCGDFVGSLAEKEGLDITQEDVAAFTDCEST